MKKTVLLTSICTLVGMFCYESLKELIAPHFSKWESHVVTIFFTTILVTVIVAFFLKKREDYLSSSYIDESRRKDMLIREIYHRVKNNMTVTISLLSLKLDSIHSHELKAAMHETINCMENFREIYDLLLQKDEHENLCVRLYLSELMERTRDILFTGNRLQLEYHIDDFSMNAMKLLSIGIIVNELLTNTFKYAFTAKHSGCRIDLKLTRDNNRVLFLYRDNGAGLPDDSDLREGFGFSIIRALAVQLDASIDMRNENGFFLALEFLIE